MEFHEITIKDREWIRDRFCQENKNGCETVFASNFLWSSVFGTRAGECHGSLVVCYEYRGHKVFSYPIGGKEKKRVIEELEKYCHEMGQPLYMTGLYERERDELMAMFPGKFMFRESRDDEDYIYTWEKLASLSGKKLHGKRNHIARFKDGNDWSYEKITGENLEECRKMSFEWKESNSDKWNEGMEEEFSVLQKAFDYYEVLNLKGGLLKKQGRVVAFSIGEPLNSNTFVVHFEKAFAFVQGAYPMINQQFVINECKGYEYINREEDAGDLRLRKAKLSYYPDILLKKFHASEGKYDGFTAASLHPEMNKKDIINIWKTCFGDPEDVISYYIGHRMTKENMLGIFKNEQLVSMASFLPAVYHIKGEGGSQDKLKEMSVLYVYAVATLPEYRNLGLAAELIRNGQKLWEMPLILSPAKEGLYSYYGKMGFEKRFLEKRKVYAFNENHRDSLGMVSENSQGYAGDGIEDLLEDVSPEEYKKIRDKAFLGEGYVEWPQTAVSFALSFNSFMGGQAKKVKAEDAVILYDIRGEELYVTETTLKEEKREKLFKKLCRIYNAKRAVYAVPGGMYLPFGGKEAGGNLHVLWHATACHPAQAGYESSKNFHTKPGEAKDNKMGYLNLVLD